MLILEQQDGGTRKSSMPVKELFKRNQESVGTEKERPETQ